MYLLRMAAILITLAGCTHEVALQSLDGQFIGRATLKFEGNNSGSISLDRNGEIYQGRWIATKVDEGGKIASTYGIGSKKYKDYQRGSGNYLQSGQSTLQSNQGDILNCEFKYRGTAVQGSCRSETDNFEFINKQE